MIEILVVMAIVTVLAGLGLWIGMDSFRGYSYRSERNRFISSLQKARLESMTNINESKHGVRVESDKYVIFEGDSYDSNPNSHEISVLSGGVNITGVTFPYDAIFDQLSGTASGTTLNITDGARNSLISINNEGRISW